MFTLTAAPGTNGVVVLALTGNVNESVLPEIDRILKHGKSAERVVFDMSEVTLIDRVAARFFAEQMRQGIELVDCPGYLSRWILREFSHGK